MLFKSTLALAFVALANIVSAGQTPACLLSVIGDSSNPADLSTLCGSDAKKLESQISNKCGDKSQSALKFFANTCNSNGHNVDISSISNSTASGTATASSSGFVTATSGAQATGSGTSTSGAASGSASGSSSGGAPTATTNAAVGLQLQDSALLAAVFLGAAALL
ncbi:Period circadian protein [Penicillium macrosclerotiorum]|uniref:Period circadian protein n=1 Tax=Penicillium macrosclerotiorum TaxID=303699 RepID=UPI0025488036|nr:Period circadian protein [Penicillium macrosclerotiorum]KAJ5673968.1 Period circadian protein [Penicillium macrosclerotiorum]